MEKHTVFLNFIPEDQAIAEQIHDALNAAHIPVYVPPQNTAKDTILEITSQIEALAKNEGIMLVILSQRAIHNSLFISNIQYLCELTRERMALLVFQIEDLPGDNAVALYSSQAFLLRTEQDARKDLEKIITRVKRMLGMEESPLLERFPITQKGIKRVFVWVAILIFIVAIINYFFPIFGKKDGSPTQLTIEPFSGESVEQGLIVDRRFVPAYAYNDDPAAEAPFSYNPVHMFKTLTFDDPIYENLLDTTNVRFHYPPSINEMDLFLVKQSKGVLQLSASAQDIRDRLLDVRFNYLFDLSNTTYIGIRFRMEDYQGWTDVQDQIVGSINISSYLHLVDFNINKQTISIPWISDDLYELGDEWHALEFVINPDTFWATISLDGKEIGAGYFYPNGRKLVSQLFITYEMEATTDWVHFYVDEIRYGGESTILLATTPDQIDYHSTPEEIYSYNNFNDGFLLESTKENSQNIKISNGEVEFSIPAGQDFERTSIEIKDVPFSEINYIALKYRLPAGYSDCAHLFIKIQNELYFEKLGEDIEFEIGECCSSFNAALYSGMIDRKVGTVENYQPDSWHSLEMAIFKPDCVDCGDPYSLFVWHDGNVLHYFELRHLALLADPAYTSSVIVGVNRGSREEGNYLGEIDEITMGYVSSSVGNE